MEAMIETGVHFGFSREIATKLAYSTVKGSAIYAQSSDKHPAELRSDITSPGGTTASAVYALEKGAFRTTVADGLWSAYRRSLELGEQDSNKGPDRVIHR
uniref:Pyrroline-5-carboxylate reductase dimerisation domain-containing protein n=1 Tax=Octactis speculum TaxID=3111310 RepID=A0A7S2ARJ7_9STRA|mmetsp:Transcript_14506/g.19343  ORF Transcript_14506/g.19343 Transcript_14506/m.19343 type:complete len:100 (+) Transcript_14506:157-456(+)